MATTWIHRLNTSDILVYFDTLHEARKYAIQFFLKYNGDLSMTDEQKNSIWFSDLYSDENGVYSAGNSRSLQVSFMLQHGMPPLPAGLTSWNTLGTVLLSPEEAMRLGTEGEPEGFIPGESEGLWKKETRSAKQLDQELETYMQGAA